VYKVALTIQSALVEHEVRIAMRTVLEPSIRNCVVKVVASSGAVLLCAGGALAGPVKNVEARGSGQVVSRTFLSETEFLQEAHVSGTATILGRFDGVLSDHVNLNDGTFTGIGVFTMPDGSTITTAYLGLVGPPDLNGVSSFIEYHHVVDGTGKFDGASGDMTVTGTVDGAGHIEIVAVGTLDK
jgi:hypothetical protein